MCAGAIFEAGACYVLGISSDVDPDPGRKIAGLQFLRGDSNHGGDRIIGSGRTPKKAVAP
jgi:hypothetical protein